MKLHELFSLLEGIDDADHFDALAKTGFFGSRGAGCVFLANDTGRFLISHRSSAVEQPGTWGNYGGAIDNSESPIDAVKREAHEEAGYNGAMEIIPLLVFRKGNFSYSNFLAVVEKEFTPIMDWESQGFRWVKWNEWPQPLHFGLQSLFSDQKSIATIKEILTSISDKRETE